MHEAIELSATGIEVFAVGIIVVSFILATFRFLIQVFQKRDAAYAAYRLILGRSLLLGLEFLVAADVIRTVALEPTLKNIGILGVLVTIRTFLSWSLVLEMEGHWPWRAASVESEQTV